MRGRGFGRGGRPFFRGRRPMRPGRFFFGWGCLSGLLFWGMLAFLILIGLVR
jgi:hypothetical protein